MVALILLAACVRAARREAPTAQALPVHTAAAVEMGNAQAMTVVTAAARVEMNPRPAAPTKDEERHNATLKAIYEATEVQGPDTFIILPEKLPQKGSSCGEESGDVANLVERALEPFQQRGNFQQHGNWLDRWSRVGAAFREGKEDEIADTLKEAFSDLIKARPVYFYLVDGLTGMPVQGNNEIYPIEIDQKSEVVPELLPLMKAGIRGMSLYNGVVRVGRMLGMPEELVPLISEKWGNNAQELIEIWDSVNDPEEQEAKAVRGAQLRKLQNFLDLHDKNRTYCGLKRVHADDGTALWTALAPEEQAAALVHWKKEQDAKAKKAEAKARGGAGPSWLHAETPTGHE